MLNGVGPARGVLAASAGAGRFRHERHAPAAPLDAFVEHFWSVHWDLIGLPAQTRETLPHPSVHLLVEHDASRIAGVATGRFSRRLEGEGCVFGVKFKPGGFRPFLRAPLAAISDRSITLAEVFGAGAVHLEAEVLAAGSMPAMIAVASGFLAAHLPAPDPMVAVIDGMVRGIVEDRGVTRVEQLVQRHGIGKRALQRLFADYVGVSPKWVIARYRLHDALERLADGGPADWPELALSLGYFDQAHFIRDFRRMIGATPSAYLQLIRTTRAETAGSPRSSTS